MAAAPAGEAPALDLTGALRDSIYHYVRSRVRSPEAADDLTQEVLLRAATKAETVRRRERLESWLCPKRRDRPPSPLEAERAREELRKTIQRCCRLETDRYGAVVECEPRSPAPCKCD